MRAASGGSTSSMPSGRSQRSTVAISPSPLDTASLVKQTKPSYSLGRPSVACDCMFSNHGARATPFSGNQHGQPCRESASAPTGTQTQKSREFTGCRINAWFCHRVTRRALSTAGWVPSLRRGGLQIAEEIALGVQHQHIFLVGEALAVCLQAAVEGVELLVLPIGRRVDRRRLRIAVTAQLFGFAEGLCQQHPTLAIGVGTTTFGQFLTRGAMLAGFTLTLGAHPLEHAAVHLTRQVDTLDTHVHHLDAQLLLRRTIEGVGDLSHQLVTLPRH